MKTDFTTEDARTDFNSEGESTYQEEEITSSDPITELLAIQSELDQLLLDQVHKIRAELNTLERMLK